jgi:hypothetical protein
MMNLDDTFFFNTADAALSFIDCELGDAVFNNKKAAQFIDTDALNGTGSIFGEGMLAMIVALLALIASAVSICMTIVYNKKKTAPVTADNTAKNKTEDE